ncbi:MAG: hypothetical protein ACI92C_002365 [Neolewinella sp.]|jgi:hypothetical protein
MAHRNLRPFFKKINKHINLPLHLRPRKKMP